MGNWFRRHVGHASVGTMIMVVIFASLSFFSLQYDRYKEYQYLSSDIESTTFKVNILTIPDFVRGNNPLVHYYIDIKNSFIGDYRTNILDAQGKIACHGGEVGIYYKKDRRGDPLKRTFNWFVGSVPSGATCNLLSPGEYYAEVTYTIQREGYPDRYYTATSNVFNIKTKDYIHEQ